MKKLEKTFIHKLFALLIIGLIGFSCSGKRTPGTTTTLNFAGAFGDANFQDAISGGLIIHGKNKTGPGAFFVNVTGAASLTKELPNGDWDFVGIAWDGDKFSGNVSCEVFSKTLSGEDAGVTLIFSPSKCKSNPRNVFGLADDPFFETDGQFTPLKFLTCAGFAKDAEEHFATGATELPDSIDCMYEPGRAKSFKLVIPGPEFFDIEVDESGNPIEKRNQAALESICLGTSSDGLASDVVNAEYQSTVRFPFIFNPFPLKTSIIAYDNHNCTPNGSEEVINFNGGIGKRIPGYFKGLAKASDSITNVYLDSKICEGTGLADNTFAGQPFNTSGTNYICTANQLAFIGNDANYLSGRFKIMGEIDLVGNNSFPINNGTFTGELSGGRIINGTAPLFATIGGAEIRRIEIDGFNVTAVDETAFGILANNVVTGTNNSLNVEEISLDNSSITVSGTAGNIGGLFGEVHNSYIRIEDININNFSITSVETGTNNIGGLVGYFHTDTASGQGEIDLNRFNIKNISIDAAGKSNVGGILGYGYLVSTQSFARQSFNVRSGDLVNLNITNATSFVGGIAGRVFHSVGANYQADFEVFDVFIGYETATNLGLAATDYLGGIVGNSNASQTRFIRNEVNVNLKYYDTDFFGEYRGGLAGTVNFAFIWDNKIEVNITPTSNEGHNYTGGIAGSAGDVNIKNNDIKVNFILNGSRVAGIAGRLTATNGNSILDNRVVGIIDEKTGLNSEKRGGVAGEVISGANLISNFYSALDIHGKEFVGGIVGMVQDSPTLVQINSAYLDSALIEADSVSLYGSGGLVGRLGDVSTIKNVVLKADFRIYEDVPSKGGHIGDVPAACLGRISNIQLLGLNEKGASTASESTVVSSTFDCSADTTDLGAGTLANATIVDNTTVDLTSNTSSVGLYSNADGMMMWEYASGNSLLSFMQAWKLMDNSPIASRSFGTYHDPFYINNVFDWDKIGDNPFLMSKSFKLGNNIDFNNSFDSHIGSVDYPFVGSFIPNYKSIQNVTYDVSAITSSTGLFGALGRLSNHPLQQDFGMIGNFDDPLIIKNFKLIGDANINSHYGVIGQINDGNGILRVENGLMQMSGSAGFVGGLVGQAVRGAISASSFQGNLDTPGSSNVGGLIGAVAHNGADGYDFRIEESKAKIGFLKSTQKAGGLVGTYSVSNQPIRSELLIRESYIELLDRIEVANASAMVGGLVGRFHTDNSTTGRIDVETSYVNLEGSNGFVLGASPIPDAFFSIGGSQAGGAQYNFQNVHLIREPAQLIASGLTGSTDFHNTFDEFLNLIQDDYDWDVGYEWSVQKDSTNGDKQSLTLWWENMDPRCFDDVFAQNNQTLCEHH